MRFSRLFLLPANRGTTIHNDFVASLLLSAPNPIIIRRAIRERLVECEQFWGVGGFEQLLILNVESAVPVGLAYSTKRTVDREVLHAVGIGAHFEIAGAIRLFAYRAGFWWFRNYGHNSRFFKSGGCVSWGKNPDCGSPAIPCSCPKLLPADKAQPAKPFKRRIECNTLLIGLCFRHCKVYLRPPPPTSTLQLSLRLLSACVHVHFSPAAISLASHKSGRANPRHPSSVRAA